MFQQKAAKYSLETKPIVKLPGRRIVKNKEIKSTIFLNLGELPLGLNKQNQHSNVPVRVQSAMSRYQSRKKRLSLESNKKSSFSKKCIVDEQSLKMHLRQQRRKYNLSCNSMIDEHQLKRKKSMRSKRPSLYKSKDNTVKDLKNISVKDIKKPPKKSIKNKKIILQSKSISIKQEKGKKKLSTSIVTLKKPKKNKIVKEQIIQQQSYQQDYPTNKYMVDKPIKVKKSKSKCKKLTASMCAMPPNCDAACFNLISRSSQVMDSGDTTERQEPKLSNYVKPDPIVKLKTLEYSVDIKEIRYYQSVPVVNQIRSKYSLTDIIQIEVKNTYPTFTKTELKFLAAVIFIQRKWREHFLYKQIFKKRLISKSDSQPIKQIINNRQIIINKQLLQNTQKLTLIDPHPTKTVPKQQQTINYEQQTSMKSKSYIYQKDKKYNQFNNQINQLIFQKQSSRLSQRINYDFLQNQIFPSIIFLTMRQNAIRDKLQYELNELLLRLQRNQISYNQYLKRKEQYEIQFQTKNKCLGKSKKDIKKGCLKWVDSIKESGLRKVSSQSGFMSLLYQRIYRLERMEDSSEDSNSLKRLCKRLLIRKDHQMPIQIVDFQKSVHIVNIKKQQSQKMLQGMKCFDLDQTEDKKQIKCFRSHRDNWQNNQFNNGINNNSSDKKTKYFNDNLSVQFTPQLNKKQQNEKIIRQQIFIKYCLQVKQFITQNISKEISQKQIDKILQYILLKITQQFYKDLIELDDKREKNNSDYLSAINLSHNPNTETFSYRPQGSESMSLNEDYEKVFQHSREIYKLDLPYSPKLSSLHSNRCEDTFQYLKQLICYLQQQNEFPLIIKKINQNQGFTPLQYLRFLRDFQIPSDQYNPLISNQLFLQWQSQYIQKQINTIRGAKYRQKINSNNNSVLELQTIFHRASFQALLSLIEQYRPCGEKGIPFPWENTIFFRRQIDQEKIIVILAEVLQKIQLINQVRCGIIQEKHFIYSREDQERVQEQNESRIIDMIEKEFNQTKDEWYEIQQHALQYKLQVEKQIYMILIKETVKDIRRI